ncbi:MAG: LysR family transcriptional regulator [Eubacteriales bacterium]|nr:LysR family transcriptional regulator [Eubacteriales bacterium]
MNLKTIEYFLVTAEEENVTKAAERLYISQQALSAHIKRLEEEYGVAFFDRKPVFRLTEAGRRMVFYGKQLLKTEEEMKADFSDIEIHSRATLRVGISRLRSGAFFPHIWELYRTSHPNISIELVDGNSRELSEYLSVGKVDLYIGIDTPVVPIWKAEYLYVECCICLFRRSLLQQYYPEKWRTMLQEMEKSGVSLQEMTRMPFIGMRDNNRLRKTVDKSLPRDIKLTYILESNQQDLICRMAADGYGVGLVSPAAFYRFTEETTDRELSDLCAYPLDDTVEKNRCELVYRSDWRVPRYVQDFIEDTHKAFSIYEEKMHFHVDA